MLFARKLRDTVPVSKEGLLLRPEWVLTRDRREQALAGLHQVKGEAWPGGWPAMAVMWVGLAAPH